MHIMVFDTETTGLDKPFCYDIGYLIIDTENWQTVKRNHYVVEQIWHNLPLFESAYYKEKRSLYVAAMRAHKIIMEKYGYIMQAMARDIKNYSIEHAYAYNSDFDDKVFTYNCDWFKCINPLENVEIHDIWGYASQHITYTDEYKLYCENNSFFTDTGNYKGSAEIVYRFITQQTDFVEAHMGLDDAIIEAEILKECIINRGANLNANYTVNRVLPRITLKPFTVKVNGKEIYHGEYYKKYARNDIYNFTTV